MFYFRIRDYYRLGLNFPVYSTNKTFCNSTRVNTTLLSYNPKHASMFGLGFFRFARRYSGNTYLFLFLWVLRCFSSPGTLSESSSESCRSRGFSHSEIFGSKVARHFPEAYRSLTTSFIASQSQGIHRMPLKFLLGTQKTTIHCLYLFDMIVLQKDLTLRRISE